MRQDRFAAAAGVAVCLCLAGPVLAADLPKAAVQGVSDARLRALIVANIGKTDHPPASRFEARRRAESAAEDAVAVLRSQGYYEYEIEPDVGDGDSTQAIVRITPGPRFVFAQPGIVWTGHPPTTGAQVAAESSVGLTLGAPGKAADVLGGEGRIVASLEKRGYADAAAEPREVVVDHADHTVQPTFHINAGERVLLDGLDLETHGRTKRAWVSKLAPWRKGEIYDPDDVAELERRLLDTGAYESVTVALAPQAKARADGTRPVVVSLADRPSSTLEFGASYSTAEGAGIDDRWTSYNHLGRGDTLTVLGQIAQIKSQLAIELALPHWREPGQTFKVGASLFHDDTHAYNQVGERIDTDITRRVGPNDYRTLGLSLDRTRSDEKFALGSVVASQARTLNSLIGLAALAVDRSNDPLNPVRGWRLEARAEPTISTGDTTIMYVRAETQGSIYIPFDKNGNTVVAARAKAGLIIGGNLLGITASRRFYAGGGGSVRGYAYQGVGSRFPDNSPKGGLSLVEGSLELRQHVAGAWSGVLFADAGDLGDRQTFDFNAPSASVGLGVRYDLGFAPIRVDVALPLNPRKGDAPFQVYLSIGQSF